MALVLLASATGSPGVTTSSLLLALTWPRDVVLVDADRIPSQAIESGYLRDRGSSSPGLITLAQERRSRVTLTRAVWEQSVRLTDGDQPNRRFLPGFTHPGASDLFAPAWEDFAATLADLESAGVDVVVDAGRIGSGLPTGLVRHADLVMIATRTSLRALAATRLSLPSVMEPVGETAAQAEFGLLIIGPGQPYGESEVAHQFGVPVLGSLPHDAAAAGFLSDGDGTARKFDRSALLRAGIAVSQRLAQRVGRRSRVLGDGEPRPAGTGWGLPADTADVGGVPR